MTRRNYVLLGLALALLAVSGCGIFGPPDQKPRRNYDYVTSRAKTDPDHLRAGQAIADAEGILGDAQARQDLADFVKGLIPNPPVIPDFPWAPVVGGGTTLALGVATAIAKAMGAKKHSENVHAELNDPKAGTARSLARGTGRAPAPPTTT